MNLKEEIAKIIENQDTGLSFDEALLSIETPPNSDMGDFAFPCFRLAKTMRKAPQMIASDLSKSIKSELFKEVRALGPYVNFFVDSEKISEFTLKEIFEKGKAYGSSDIGKDKNVIIEYSSTNIAKPFHIGHIRSTVIGDSLKRIHKFLGFNVTGINYLGDYGTQFGILISAYKKWGDDAKLNEEPIKELLNLYVKYNTLVDESNDDSLMNEARSWFKKLEDADDEALKIWSWFKEISLKEFRRVYEILDIDFDSYDGEYYHSKFVDDVVEEIKSKNLLRESDGASVIDFDDKDMAPAIVIKSDGTSTYIARDIATAIYRKKTYDFHKNIYVVAIQQNLHFRQLKEILKKMGYEWADDCIHVQFGMVGLKDGAMSTRKGKVIFLEDVLNNAIDKTRQIMEERNPNIENKDEVSKKIGIGAVKFQELFNTRIKDYTFDWDQILNFDGETGPYVQYSYARANSILNRLGHEVDTDVDYSLLSSKEEKELIMNLYQAPEQVVNAMNKLEPSIITRHVTETAKLFNKFYNSVHIMNSEEESKKARILLVYATKVVIKNLLALLGIETVEKM